MRRPRLYFSHTFGRLSIWLHCVVSLNNRLQHAEGEGGRCCVDSWWNTQNTIEVGHGINKGEDGLIRSANVETSTGKMNRSITKLYPLEITAAEQPTIKSTREVLTTPTQPPPQYGPICQAALWGHQRVQQWIDSLPPSQYYWLTDIIVLLLLLYCC